MKTGGQNFSPRNFRPGPKFRQTFGLGRKIIGNSARCEIHVIAIDKRYSNFDKYLAHFVVVTKAT